MIPGRMRGGRAALLANAIAFLALAIGTQVLARGSLPWNPAAWAAPWSGDFVLVAAGLLFLGLGFLMPLHAGVLNLGVHAQFLAGFAVAAAIRPPRNLMRYRAYFFLALSFPSKRGRPRSALQIDPGSTFPPGILSRGKWSLPPPCR